MTVTQGTSGYFWAGVLGSGASVGEISSWTLNETADTVDVSVFGDRWKDFVNGSVSFSGSISGFFDCSDTGQGAVMDSLEDGTVIEAYFFWNGTKYKYGSCYVTGVTIEDTHSGVATFSADLQGTGELYMKCA